MPQSASSRLRCIQPGVSTPGVGGTASRSATRIAFALFTALTAILLSACSLAGDVTPPPGSVSAASLPPVETQPTAEAPAVAEAGLGYPSSLPSAANGAVLYAQHCVQCHGESGAGDGAMASQLQNPPPDFNDLEVARNATPKQWFDTITQGNLERFMPPFGESLTEVERWDLAFYLFTFTASQESVDQGQEIYAAQCANCHGEGGQGDGPEAASNLIDFTSAEAMANKSQAEILDAITDGVGQAMPAFRDALAADERLAVANYLRAFSYEYTAPGAPAAEALGVVTGQVVNGTANQPSPSGLDLILYGFDNFQLTTTMTETMQADGTFLFGDVPFTPGRAFVVTTEYNGVNYSSDIGSFESGATNLELPLSVYDATSDPAALRVDRMHVFFDFSTDGQATVGELFILSNIGDKTVIGAGLQFDLPDGAAGLRIQNAVSGEDYVETSRGFTLTTPVPPGASASQLLISFSLPFNRKLAFSQRLPFPTASVNVLVPDLGVKVAGDQLQDDGVRDVQGTPFQSFSGANFAAGSVLAFDLSGGAGGGSSFLTGDTRNLLVGGLTFALAIAAVVWWYYSRKAASPAARISGAAQADVPAEELLQAIADLDDAYTAGQLAKSDYDRQRANLKAELMRKWK